MKEPSIFSLAGLCAGFIFGAVLALMTVTQDFIDTYISIGKSQVSWQINTVSLGTCAGMLREDTLTHESQKDACAYFIEQAVEAVQ